MTAKSRSKADKFNAQWFDDRLAEVGLSKRGLAAKMQLDSGAVSLMLRGKRKMQTAEAVEIARILKVPVADVLTNAGVKIEGTGTRSVPVVGWVDGEKESGINWDVEAERIPCPPDLPHGAVAVQVRSPQDVRDGEILFTMEPGKGVPAESIGRLCLVKAASGAVSISYVRRGYKRDHFNLISTVGGAANDVALEWATPIFWVKSA